MRITRKGTLRFLDGYDLLLTVVAAGRTDPVGRFGLVAMAARGHGRWTDLPIRTALVGARIGMPTFRDRHSSFSSLSLKFPQRLPGRILLHGFTTAGPRGEVNSTEGTKPGAVHAAEGNDRNREGDGLANFR